MKEKIIENKGAKYCEMLYEIVERFDHELPDELSFEDTLEIGIEAWNLANKKHLLDENNMYKKELKNYEFSDVIDKMVTYKLEKFSEYTNVIVDYSVDDERLQVKSQKFEDYQMNLFANIILNSKFD